MPVADAPAVGPAEGKSPRCVGSDGAVRMPLPGQAGMMGAETAPVLPESIPVEQGFTVSRFLRRGRTESG